MRSPSGVSRWMLRVLKATRSDEAAFPELTGKAIVLGAVEARKQRQLNVVKVGEPDGVNLWALPGDSLSLEERDGQQVHGGEVPHDCDEGQPVGLAE